MDLCDNVFIFLFVAQILYTPLILLFFFISLLFTRFWFVSVLYAGFIYYDRNTAKRGGRLSSFFVNFDFWQRLRRYFPHDLIKTEELPSDRNYMFCVHPHGIYNLTFFLESLYYQTTYADRFPGIQIKPLALDSALSLPFHREFLLSIGMTSISRQGFEYWFRKHSKGIALKFSVGGLEESLDAKPDTMVINLNNKKGFVKLALKHGVSLVPVFQFGENELFVPNPRFAGLQKFLIKNLGFYLPVCSGEWLNMPFKRPVYTVVGKPIHVEKVPEPTNDQVLQLHTQYVESVKTQFAELNQIYGSRKATLIVK